MAYYEPFGALTFVGVFASDAEAEVEILARHWDTNGDGTGLPTNTLYYLDSTSGKHRYYFGGWQEWAGEGGQADWDDILINNDGNFLVNEDGNLLVSG